MRRIAVTAIGSAAFLGILATPANADGPADFGPARVSTGGYAQGGVPAAGVQGDWTWSSRTNMQSQNGLVNVANNGNMCLGLVGVLAPATSCVSY